MPVSTWVLVCDHGDRRHRKVVVADSERKAGRMCEGSPVKVLKLHAGPPHNPGEGNRPRGAWPK